jgi:hypothetical protein
MMILCLIFSRVLDADYNGLVENVSSRIDPISLSNLFAQLLAVEAGIKIQAQAQALMSANATGRGGGQFNGPFRGRGGCDGGCGGHSGGRGRGRGASAERPVCQICEKIGHNAGRCWKRFDHDFKLEEKSANNAMNPYGSAYDVDTNWYTDTGDTYHITSKLYHITFELDKLSTKEKYMGQEKIQIANGSSMRNRYIGKSTLQPPCHNLYLNKILHVPTTHKNLLSVHRLTTDNPIFVEYHSRYFLVKDRATRKALLQG